MLRALPVFLFACRLYPLAFNNRSTVRSTTSYPISHNAPASFAPLFDVHRNGDSDPRA